MLWSGYLSLIRIGPLCAHVGIACVNMFGVSFARLEFGILICALKVLVAPAVHSCFIEVDVCLKSTHDLTR